MKKSRKTKKFFKNGSLHLMMMPALILLLIYNYIPLAGNIMAFQKFNPSKGFFHSNGWGLKIFSMCFICRIFTRLYGIPFTSQF